MCGIAGIYNLKDGRDDGLIEGMVSVLSHRGPDQEGIYKDTSGGVFLGHKRLSIIDLSEKGKQPMKDPEDEVVIVYNGETYNFQEIKDQLKDKYHFQSSSDTEVLLYAYKEWGIDFIKKINGMFAFLLYDKRKHTLYAVRDRLGIKPLFYCNIGERIILASEIKSILKCGEYKRELNYKAVSSYLSYRYPLGNVTFFNGIYSLEPGCVLTITKEGLSKKTYWELSVKEKEEDKGEAFYLRKAKELFDAAVRMRMISDVPLGAYLSGGLDSSAVVAAMAKNSTKPVKTFTIGFEEEGHNEFKYSRKVAERYKTEHREIVLSSENYIEAMRKLIRFKDAPLGIPNEIPLYLMSVELKKYITVVLSGEGADEIFSGYGKIFRSPIDYEKIEFFRKLPFLRSFPLFRKTFTNLRKKYLDMGFNNQLEHFLSQYTYFPVDEKFDLFTENMKKKTERDNWIKELFREHLYRFKTSYYKRISYVFEKMHLPGLLQRVDNCTMATSVEARVPFVDHKLVEFMMDVPVKYKMRWRSLKHFLSSLTLNSDQISEDKDITKYLLREINKDGLPPDIIERRKKGFPVPLDIWFKKDFIELTKKELLSAESKVKDIFDQDKLREWVEAGASKNFGQKLWMVLNLEYFLREYF